MWIFTSSAPSAFDDGEEFGNVLGAPVAEPQRPLIVGLVELDLELPPIPSGLGGVVVGINHESTVAYMTTASMP